MNKSNKAFKIAGRILFALPFMVLGMNHFIMTDFYLGMETTFIPIGGYTIMFTGALLFFAGVSIVVNKFVPLSIIVLSILLLTFIATIDIPNLFNDTSRAVALITLFKDVGLLGGAILIGTLNKNLS